MRKEITVRDNVIDILRLLAIIAVVIVHTTTRTIQASNNDLADFSFSLFLNQIFRYAVPMFFLISGYVLEINYKDLKFIEYLKKRLGKIFVPYVFWSLVYYLFIFKNPSENFLKELVSGDASYQLYFIPALFIFYLIFPFLHKHYSKLVNIYVVSGLGALELFLLSYDYYIKPIVFFYPLSVVFLNYYSFLIGMVFVHYREKIKYFVDKRKTVLALTAGLLGVEIFLEGKERYLATLNYLTFYSSWRPSIIIYSVVLTVFLYYVLTKFKLNSTFVRKLSELSFFVYFIHVAILVFVWKYLGAWLYNLIKTHEIGRIIFDPILFLTVFSLSCLIGVFVRKIPALSKITG